VRVTLSSKGCRKAVDLYSHPPAASLAQDRESTPAELAVLTTMPRHQQYSSSHNGSRVNVEVLAAVVGNRLS